MDTIAQLDPTGELRAELDAAYKDPEKYRAFIMELINGHVEGLNETIEALNTNKPLNETLVSFVKWMNPARELDAYTEHKRHIEEEVESLKELLDEMLAKIKEFHP